MNIRRTAVKRITAFLICILIGALPDICTYAQSEKVFSEKTKLVFGLGLFDSVGEVKEESYVSGKEFAAVLEDIVGETYTERYRNMKNVQRIQMIDAVKVMVDIMGYGEQANAYGGFPQGYWQMAGQLGILSGIKKKAADRIIYGDLSILLYNCLDVPIVQYKTMNGKGFVCEVQDEKTFLTEILQMQKIKGRIVANAYVCLDGGAIAGIDAIRIGNMTFYDAGKSCDLIGKTVTAYYSTRGEEEQKFIYAVPDKNMYFTEIPAAEIEKYMNHALYYRDAKGKLRHIRLEGDAQIIRNSELLKSYSQEDFLFDNGFVTLIGNSSTTADTVLIESYTDFVVAEIDREKDTFYNKLTDSNGIKNLTLTEDAEVFDQSGKKLEISEIQVQDVLSVCQSNARTRILVGRGRAESIVISRVETENLDVLLHTDEETFRISRTYRRSRQYVSPEIGETVSCILNAFGEIAWIVTEKDDETINGYLMKAWVSDEGDDVLFLKIITSDGMIEQRSCTPKVSLYTGARRERLNTQQLYERLRTYQGVIVYTPDNDKLVKRIDLPADDVDFAGNSRLIRIDLSGKGGLAYKRWPACFGGQVYISEKTIIYAIPADTHDFENYQVISRIDLNNDGYYTFEAYTDERESVVAEVVVIKNYIPTEDPEAHAVVVTEITEAISKDDTILRKVSGVIDGTPVTMWAEIDADGNSVFERASDFPTKTNTLRVVPGDIIRIVESPKTGYVQNVDVLFKADVANPAFPDGQIGNLSGTTGVYGTDIKNGNPYARDGSSLAANAKVFNGAALRMYYGWVYRKSDGIITVTNQDLSCGQFAGENEKYVVESHMVSVYRDFTVVSENDRTGAVLAKSGSDADIHSYQDVGGDCSRVLIITAWGDPIQLVVLN